jgi:hypothetical protein
MRGKTLFLIFGLVLGISATLAFSILKSSAPPPTPEPIITAQENERKQLKKTVVELTEKNALLKKEAVKLSVEIDSFKNATQKKTDLESETKPPATSAMSGLVKTAMTQQVEIEISTMKLRCHLTDDQEKAIRALLEKQIAEAGDMFGKMLGG